MDRRDFQELLVVVEETGLGNKMAEVEVMGKLSLTRSLILTPAHNSLCLSVSLSLTVLGEWEALEGSEVSVGMEAVVGMVLRL
jgi:hypothetical protein